MITAPSRRRWRADLITSAVAALAVFAASVADPGEIGKLLAALAVGVLVAVLALRDPLLASLLFVLVSFSRLAQQEVLSVDLLTPALIIVVLSLVLAVGRRAYAAPRLGVVEWLMAAYLSLNVVSWLLPHQYAAIDPITGESSDVYRLVLTGVVVPFAAYFVGKTALRDDRAVVATLWAIVAMSAYSAWVSILQFHGPRALVWPRYIIDSPNWVGRANGVFNQPVVNGMLLDIGFLACLFLASRAGTRRSVQVALYLVAIASAYAVYLTHTRIALVVLFLTVGLGVALAKGWRRAFAVSAFLGVAAIAVNASSFFSTDRYAGGVGSSTEVYDRLNIMATGLRAIGENPVFGIGLARYLPYNTWNHVQWSPSVPWHNGYNLFSHENEIGIAAEVGIPAALAWIAVLVALVWLSWRAMRELPASSVGGSPLALVAIVAMLGMIANGTTVDLRLLEFATLVPFLLAGAVVGRLERQRAERAAPGAGREIETVGDRSPRPRSTGLVSVGAPTPGAGASVPAGRRSVPTPHPEPDRGRRGPVRTS